MIALILLTCAGIATAGELAACKGDSIYCKVTIIRPDGSELVHESKKTKEGAANN